ncbi:MAG: response regulator transcription factor [Bacillota bacterium]|nr:response regulator transcription factor [Bacillota bacterium]
MIKVIIAEDMDILRESLKYMIESDPDMEVVGLASNGLEAIDLCRKHKPDIALMDIKMPKCDGIESTKHIRAEIPSTKVIILTTFEDEQSIYNAIEVGVDGYITKDIIPNQLQQSIKTVVCGLGVVNRRILDSIFSIMEITPSVEDDNQKFSFELSKKEISIIRMVVEGKSYKDMGRELFLSEGYVRNILSDILGKFHLKDRLQLAVFAVKNNIFQ